MFREKNCPVSLQQMTARFHAEVTRPIEAELWTATFTLLGLRYDPDFAHTILRGVRDIMRESTTYQALINEGEAKGIAKGGADFILRYSSKRLGKPPRKLRDAILAIRDESRLEKIYERAPQAKSWNELLDE